MTVSPEWQETISGILARPGVVMLVGAVDTGKTTFCLQLCRAAVEAGIRAAVVDADVGQSEIGAPGTIGMALMDGDIESLSRLKPKRLYFVGSTSPAAHVPECVVGASKMTSAALEQNAELVVVDTTGLVSGTLGRRLKTHKIDLVRPAHLVAVQRRREIEHLLSPFRTVETIEIRRVPTSSEVKRKPPEMRAARRKLNFHRHFHDSQGHIIRLDDVSFWHTWFGTGRQMKWQYMKFIEDTLKCRVLHAEVSGSGVFIVSERACDYRDRRVIEEEFKTRNITVIDGSSFQHLLVGLADEHGRTLNVALLQAIDFRQRFMFVLSPIRTVSPVRVVQFGSIRVTRAGEEIGTLAPGDL